MRKYMKFMGLTFYTYMNIHPFYGGNSIQNETDRYIMNIKNQKFYNPEDPDFWKEEKRKESISFFKNVLKEEFTNFIKFLPPDFRQKTLISLVPSSTEKKYNNNMFNICEYLCREFNIFNGLTILSRQYSVGTAHLCGGHRNIKTHLESIIVNTPEFIKGKSIIICYHDTKNHKPNPEPIIKAVEKYLDSEKMIFSFGDDVKDIEASKQAKIYSIACLWGSINQEMIKNSNADFICETPQDMFKLLKKYEKFL